MCCRRPDEHILHTVLQRREVESLVDLLNRLDVALTRDIYTDEINVCSVVKTVCAERLTKQPR